MIRRSSVHGHLSDLVGTAALALVVGAGAWSSASPASAWEPFITPNSHVEDGNRAMAEGDHAGALEAYDRAARELPSEPGVHLNRGLALLAAGQLADARQAFLTATEPPASPDIRADAYYDLGLAFYREGDELATALDHERAQAQFREAVDAFKRSLRARPGDRDTAWNLELALRRLREEEQRQEEQEQEQQAQNEENEQEGDNQEEQPEGSDGGDDNAEGEGEEEQQNPDEQDPSEQSEDQPSQEGEDEQPDDPDGQDGDQPNEPDSQEQQNGQPNEPEGESQGEEGSGDEELPGEVARVLDALQNSEENLERYRARARARQENRQPTKDW
jgi:hypothetical protein